MLSEYVKSFISLHGKRPDKILVAPVAAATLAIQKSLGPVWDGIQVEFIAADSIDPDSVVEPGKGTLLLVFVQKHKGQLRLRACEI